MNFLISNDDGVYAPGLAALYRELSTIGEVKVVAPNTEQSGCASALSICQPLYTQELDSGFIAVNGSPADCVYLALHQLYPDISFDCVITGINSGANLGQDVLFSGTFGSALTAQLFGIPAIATSLVGGGIKANNQDAVSQYQIAAAEVVKLLTETTLLEEIKRLPYHVLNVNIPAVNSVERIKGRKVTSLSHSQIAKPVHHVVDPRGRDAYWISLRKREHSSVSLIEPSSNQSCIDATLSVKETSLSIDADISTDAQAVAAGYVSLSPVRLHHTPTAALNRLSMLAL